MLTEIRFVLRTLRRNPGFTLTAILSIALAIGANSAIFSFGDGLLFRPLPVPNSSQVFSVRSLSPSLSSVQLNATGEVSYPDYLEFRDKNSSFEDLLAVAGLAIGFARDAKTQPQSKIAYMVSANFFQELHVEPQLGRAFRPEENQAPGRDAVVVISHDLWKQEFERDPAVAGRHVQLNGMDFIVVGVAPESFTGIDQFVRPAFFIPIMMAPALVKSEANVLTDRAQRVFAVRGRLKRGVSVHAASADMASLARTLDQSYPGTNRAFSAIIRTELQARLDSVPILGAFLGVLFTVVTLVLAIACANVANLMLSRGRARSREIAVRIAIGASRLRLVRLLMIESVIIALISGALGLLIANFAVDIFSTLDFPSDTPIQLSFQIDQRVLYFTVLVSLASAVLFGLIPALHSSGTDLSGAMKSGEADQARKRFFGRNALVVVQIAGSLVLMAAATQFHRAFTDALARNQGFRIDHRMTMRFDPTLLGYSQAQTDLFYKTLIERAKEAPGIKSAALSLSLPMTFDVQTEKVIPEGYSFPPGKESIDVMTDVVDDHYFETFGVPMISGRGFRPTDIKDSPRVVVVNEAFARLYLGEHPIGKRIRLNDKNGDLAEVIGVTVTGKRMTLIEPPRQFIYLPFSQHPVARMTLIAETFGDPSAATGTLTQVVHSIDPNMPVLRVRSMDGIFTQGGVKVLEIVGKIYTSAGFLGLVLSTVGLYAVVAYSVARRTREIGIRIALGAEKAQVVKMILRSAVTMGVPGIAIGLLLSIAANRFLSAALGAPRFNTGLLALVAACLFTTTLAAAAIPALRASRIDPQQALRQD